MNPNSNDRLDRLEALTLDLAQTVREIVSTQSLMLDAQQHMQDAQQHMQDTQQRMQDTQQRMLESQQRTDEAIQRLVDAQLHTDQRLDTVSENLNALIAVVDDLVRKRPPQ